MTYLEELFEKADRLHQDIRIVSGNIYLGAKLYDTFTLSTIRPLLDIINSCPNGRYKDYCFTKTDKNEDIYLTQIANCHDGKQLLTKTVVFCTVLMLFLSNCTF